MAPGYDAHEIDAAYAVYDTLPLAEWDEWGDLASWRSATALTEPPSIGQRDPEIAELPRGEDASG